MNDAQSQSPPSSDRASRPLRGKVLWLWRWFWRVSFVVSLGFAWYCFYVPSNTIAWADNYSSAQQQSAQSGKPLILFFTEEWCVPCRIMKRNVWADQQVAASVNSGFVPVKLDADDPDAATARNRYRVGGTPTTIITDPQGKVLFQAEGGMGKTDFLKSLAKLNLISAPHNP